MTKKKAPKVANLPKGKPKIAKMGDPDSIAEKIALEQARFSAESANRLEELYAVLLDTALGKIEGASQTNRISCAKLVLEMCNDYLEEHYEDNEDTEVDEDKPKAEVVPLISLG